MTSPFKSTLLVMTALTLASCAVGPNYKRPSAPVTATFKEAQGWKQSDPRDGMDHGPWWSVYGDPILDGLERQVVLNNQNIKAFEASYRQAEAVVRQAQASFFPSIGVNGAFQRAERGATVTAANGTTTTRTTTTNTFNANASASWEIDVWGKIRRTVESDKASAQASAADLANATLSAQAQLATAYFQLRVQDELIELLNQTVTAYTESLQIAQNKYSAGIVSKADVVEAETQLRSTQASAVNAKLQRAQLEHAIAVLIGKAPAEFALEAVRFDIKTPEIPIAVPSTLLERRPDVAAAERRVAAGNAQIGVAIAAYFPDLTVTGSAGGASSSLGSIFDASNRFWSFGPQLALTVFDAGSRSAQVARARASYDQDVANYRQTVLTALQSVEDQLTAISVLAQQGELTDAAVRSALEAERITLNQYRAGIVAFNNVITAQTAALSNKQSALTVRRNQLTASVSLVQALGGGWDPSQPPRAIAAE